MHRVIAIVLAVAVALPAKGQDVDAGAPWDAVDVHRAVIDERLPDGGVGRRIVAVGGCWLNEPACLGAAQALVRAPAEKAYLDEHVDDLPAFRWLVGAAAVGIAIGVTAGAGGVIGLECQFGRCFGLTRP